MYLSDLGYRANKKGRSSRYKKGNIVQYIGDIVIAMKQGVGYHITMVAFVLSLM